MDNEEDLPQDDTRLIQGRALWLRVLLIMAILATLYLLHRELNLLQYFTRERVGPTIDAVRTWVGRFGTLAPIVFLAVFSLAMVLNLPTGVIIVLSVVTFGRMLGGILSFLIVCLGMTTIYGIARRLGRPLVERAFGGGLRKLDESLSRRELMNVTIIRLTMFMNPAVNWLLSLSGIRYRNLMVGTLLGASPGILIIIWLSSELVDFFQSAEAANPLRSPSLLIPGALGLLLFAIMKIVDRRQHRAGRDDRPHGA